MLQFAYKAKESNGKVKEGIVDAVDQKAAMARLREQKLSVLEIKPATGVKKPKKGKVDNKEVVIFSRQRTTLVSAGVPIVQGLNILESQAESPGFKYVVGALRTDIEAGLSIADAMGKHPQAFTELYVAMIKAGEVGGILDTILERLSGFLESAEQLRSKVKSALMYTTVVFSAAWI
ncbi:MAG: type II secretion system F family protein, partial [Elusimicrobiota bacterium]|nr:type II secretion system F family protein [Elusimicrobiota bacterium]